MNSSMMKVFHIFLLTCLLFGTTGAFAEPVNNESSFRLPISNIAAGTFTQRKFFKVLKKPIISSGELYFDTHISGLVWQTKRPVESSLILKGKHLYQQNNQGQLSEIKAGANISRLLINVMSGKLQALEQLFDIKAVAQQGCYELKPKTGELTQIFDLIAICNQPDNKQKSSLVLYEKQGNRTEIDIVITPLTALPEAIRAQLE